MEPTGEATLPLLSETKENLCKEDLSSENQISTSSLSINANENSNIKYQHCNKKVEILLKATGDAPIMTIKKWKVESDRTVASIIKFMKDRLKLSPGDSLFVYVNQSFAPSPDQIMQNLYDCFRSDGKLVLHYSKTPAWG